MYGWLITAALQAAAPTPAPSPTCTCARQCDAMWVEAATSLERYTGTRLEVISSFRLESHLPRMEGLYGSVERRPIENGRDEINVAFMALPDTQELQMRAERSVQAFNESVTAAGKRIQCPASSAK